MSLDPNEQRAIDALCKGFNGGWTVAFQRAVAAAETHLRGNVPAALYAEFLAALAAAEKRGP
jgi:hypothetical protein